MASSMHAGRGQQGDVLNIMGAIFVAVIFLGGALLPLSEIIS